MYFPEPLVEGTLIRRYKRFLADVRLADGEEVTAHCPNPGAMADIAVPGNRVWLLPNRNPAAKLPYRWELEEVRGTIISVNTNNPNPLVAEALAAGRISGLDGYRRIDREVKYGERSRIDFLLSAPADPELAPACHLEVKNVHWDRGDHSAFPDSVTARGAKHMRELQSIVEAGGRAMLLFVVQRPNAKRVRVAAHADPKYWDAFCAARAAGVEARAFTCKVSMEEIMLDAEIPVDDLPSC